MPERELKIVAKTENTNQSCKTMTITAGSSHVVFGLVEGDAEAELLDDERLDADKEKDEILEVTVLEEVIVTERDPFSRVKCQHLHSDKICPILTECGSIAATFDKTKVSDGRSGLPT